jgi:hypothetical protein
MTYDSRDDTIKHIRRVQELLDVAISDLTVRATNHDASKLESPEKEVFDEATPKLRSLTYGTKEYREALADMKPALDHHYAHNDHHPEHTKIGIDGMNLFSITEMLMDWIAATERHADGDIWDSLEINEKRFNISPQVMNLLRNTLEVMGYE